MNEGENWLRFVREDLRMTTLFQELSSYLDPSDLNEVEEFVREIQARIARFRRGATK